MAIIVGNPAGIGVVNPGDTIVQVDQGAERLAILRPLADAIRQSQIANASASADWLAHFGRVEPLTAGVNARSTAGTFLDHENVTRTVPAGVTRMPNARLVQNLFAGGTDNFSTETVTVVAGNDYRVSFSGTGSITLSGAATDSLSGTANQRKAFDVFTAASTSLTATVSGTVTNAQLEFVGGQSNQAPGEYVSVGELSDPWHGYGADGIKFFNTTNGNSVTDNVVTEAMGAAITGDIGALMEPDAQNIFIYSDDVSQSTKRSTRDLTIVSSATEGPDGAQIGHNLTMGTSNQQKHFYRTFSTTSGEDYTHTMKVKPNGAAFIQIVSGGAEGGFAGTEWQNYILSGAGSLGNGTNAANCSIKLVANGFYEISYTEQATSTRDAARFFIVFIDADYNSRYPAWSGSGETYYLTNVNVFESSFPLSAIYTADVPASRTADVLRYAKADVLTGGATPTNGALVISGQALVDLAFQPIIQLGSVFQEGIWFGSGGEAAARMSSADSSTVSPNVPALEKNETFIASIRWESTGNTVQVGLKQNSDVWGWDATPATFTGIDADPDIELGEPTSTIRPYLVKWVAIFDQEVTQDFIESYAP